MAASTSTTGLAGVLNLFQGINWATISDLVEGKDTLQQGITTAEDVASVLVQGATVLGVPLAGTVNEFLPIAENLIGMAVAFLPAASGIASSITPSSTSNAPVIKTGR